MKCLYIIVAVLLPLVTCDDSYANLKPLTDADTQSRAAEGVILRLIGDQSVSFVVSIDENLAVDGRDTFIVTKTVDDPHVTVTGSSGVAVCWGFFHYLKNYCNTHISWEGDHINLPEEFPDVNITFTSLDRWRYYQNVVTTSYSFVWWEWERWEREIDWMVLNGINMALAFTGEEAIWKRVYDNLGLSDYEFSGPAFLAWNRMGNMRAFGGGLTDSWHQNQLQLQHLILDRMRELGMTPVLPAFSGLLPKSFGSKYPSASVRDTTRWNGFPDEYCCPLLLEPTDPMFNLISRLFFREYFQEFGTNHIYNSDTFNENYPTSSDAEYMAAISRAIFDGIDQVDPEGIWMLQGWMFYNDGFWGEEQVKAYVTSVPQGRLLVLDLQSDLTPQYTRFESYYGQPFIWCMLHNFGGQLGLYGFFDKVNSGVLEGRTFENSTMVGVGLAPEGINQNYVMYDFMLESPLRSDTVDVYDWVTRYSSRRYGYSDDNIIKAWHVLKDTVYSYESTSFFSPRWAPTSENVLVRRPSLDTAEVIWYNKTLLHEAFDLFVQSTYVPELTDSFLFKYDLVDVTRQIIQNTIGSLYIILKDSYYQNDTVLFQNTATQILDLLDDLDEILATNEKFLLGVWLEDAKKFGVDEVEKDYYEYNARNQITLWGPNGEILDYAAKQWSGMISHYYKPRWEMFINYLTDSLGNSSALDINEMNDDMFSNVEEPFTFDHTPFANVAVGDTFEVVRRFHDKFVSVKNFLKSVM